MFTQTMGMTPFLEIVSLTVAEYDYITLLSLAKWVKSSYSQKQILFQSPLAQCYTLTLLTLAECCSITVPVLVNKPKPSHDHKNL